MATPTFKSPAINKVISESFGVNRVASIAADVCVAAPIGCGQPITCFRDTISQREYSISGLCQGCQDTVFGGSDE